MTIAEEIEQGGLEGRVVISGSTHQHCQHSFVCRLLDPLTRSATLTSIPRFEVLRPVSGRRRELSVSAYRAERVDMELSALPKVVLDILKKVTAHSDDAADGRAEHVEAARNRQQQSGADRDRAGSDAMARSNGIQMDGHLTPLLSEAQ